jgi:glycerophosphoryl diester phosphodiesterase
VLVLGHLGNTLDAFAEVRGLGADGFELDVRRAPRGELLVHHDPIVGDPAGLPTLEQALDACAGLIVNIELKNLKIDPDFDPAERLSRDVVALLHQRQRRDRVVLSSFSLAALDAARADDATLATAYLTLPDWDQHRALASAHRRGHRGIHPHERGVTPELVQHAHAEGLTVTPWAVDDPETVRRMVDAGVDGVISDTPEAIEAARTRPV